MKPRGNPKEKYRLRNFVDHVLLQKRGSPGIYVLRQDYGRLQLNQSVVSEPINIGGKGYKHGFGTHAVSKIRVVLPEDGEKFTAEVGFDLNRHTQNASGKIVFAVQSKREVLWKSGPLAISDEATKVCVSLKGAEEIILEVTDDGSGINLAHADWADARVILKNGKSLWLEELPFDKMTVESLPPFSFNLNGVSSPEFLSDWASECNSNRAAGKIFYERKWQSPESNIEVRCEVIEFLNHPVLEWRLYFRNTGTEKSPVVAKILPLDLKISGQLVTKLTGVGAQEPPVKLHYNRGSVLNQYEYQPITKLLLDNHPVLLDCRGGRSSEQYLPFWNLDYRGQGIICGLGWSGSWKAEFYNHRDQEVIMRAGTAEMEFFLEPGEEISSPSVCLLFWEREEVIDSHNLFRHFMKDACIPKWEGKEPLPLAVAGHIFDLDNVSEENQMEVIRKVSGCGANTYWIDAGWCQCGVDGSWFGGRGNWLFPDKKKFPRGLKPVSDQAHKHGFKFLLWFDPECVYPGTAIAKEHPEWVIWRSEQKSGLFNLGIPEACEYLIELISSCIEEYGIDVYRNDFNIDPGPFWEIADEPGRKGITEIRYVEGFYRFWDELRKRHPHLLIDNCASGNKRLDYETCKRSVPLWRSDVQCYPDDPLFSVESQNQTYGLSFYLPVHSTGTLNLEPYNVRSVATGSIVLGMPLRVPGKPFQMPVELKERFAELKRYHHLFMEDFYPLTGFTLGENSWMAYQFYSPEKGEGFALFFRRSNAPYTEAEFQLKALEPESRYTVTMVDTGKKTTGIGEKVKTVKIKLKQKSSALVLIKKVR